MVIEIVQVRQLVSSTDIWTDMCVCVCVYGIYVCVMCVYVVHGLACVCGVRRNVRCVHVCGVGVCVCVRIGELQNPFPVCGGAQSS